MNEETNQAQDPVLALPSEAVSDPAPAPDPAPTAPSVEVIPVDDFLDRLAELFGEGDSDPEESEEVTELPVDESGEALEVIDGEIDVPVPAPDPATAIVEQVVEHLLDMIVDLGKIEEHTKAIEGYTETVALTVDHPALTTSFEDYTVSEALLLLLLLFAFVSACARMLRGGFSWLRS